MGEVTKVWAVEFFEASETYYVLAKNFKQALAKAETVKKEEGPNYERRLTLKGVKYDCTVSA